LLTSLVLCARIDLGTFSRSLRPKVLVNVAIGI
jgi:hypothetical protein